MLPFCGRISTQGCRSSTSVAGLGRSRWTSPTLWHRARSSALIGMLVLPFAVHPPLATVTLRATAPEEPGVKVMLFVPAPAVIAPLVMPQV